MEPVTPLGPPLADMREKDPLLVALPNPEDNDTDPPVAVVLAPLRTSIRPPVLKDPLPTRRLMLPLAPLVAKPDRTRASTRTVA